MTSRIIQPVSLLTKAGERKLISVVDALMLSRLSVIDRPNLKDPTKGNQEQDRDQK
jgi:hypothetical protein